MKTARHVEMGTRPEYYIHPETVSSHVSDFLVRVETSSFVQVRQAGV